jgi:TetR/AcrR family transcriptional regulator, ethionamide resistance regulator
MAVEVGRRRRRTPEVARGEILAAARSELESGAAELTVAGVMARTEMTRKAFYVHFRDIAAVVVALLRPLRAELDAALAAWPRDADPITAGSHALDTAMAVYGAHAPLLRAVWAPGAGPELRAARAELVEPLVTAAEQLLARRSADAGPHDRAVAEALARMNVATLLDLAGAGPADRAAAAGALRTVWTRVVLGPETATAPPS